MAARSQSGVTGYAVGLVIFVILFVLSLITAILFYTQTSDLNRKNAKLEEEIKQWVRPAERSQPEIEALRAPPTKSSESVVGGLYKENGKLKNLIAGDSKAGWDALEAQQKSLGLSGKTLFAECQRLTAEKGDADAQIKQLQDSLAAANKKLVDVEQEKAALEQNLDKGEADLKAQLQTLVEKNKSFETTLTGERQKLEDRINVLQAKYQKDISDRGTTIEQLRQQAQQLQTRIDAIIGARTGVKTPDNIDPTLLPDGQIIALSSDQKTVHINLGRTQHVPLGLTFAVYDRNAKIAKDQYNELHGKADIEVISVGENTATARIVQVEKGQTVNEGDLIANIAYDPNMVYKFYIFGDFDIDQIGHGAPVDRKRIETMVQQWGSKVVDKLSYDTDFLVLGLEPGVPEPLPKGVIQPEVIEKHAQEVRKYEEYAKLIAQAKEYKIPILNQNRFLALVGYYQR